MILQAHPLIHAAEGALFVGAVGAACRDLKIPVLTIQERDVWRRASEAAGIAEAELRAQIDGVRKTLGPPWTLDHKIAAAAALIRS
jgi:SH3-like domain-containing protein